MPEVTSAVPMTEAGPAAQKTLELPIEVLPRVYLAVVATSTMPAAQWEGLFNNRCGAECVQCGIRVTGEELRELSVLDPEEPSEDAKVDRLRLSYCARRTCESRFYRVQIEPDSDVHWTAITEQFHVATPRAREKKRKLISLPAVSLARASGIAAALLCMVVLFFLVRYWIFGYRIPIVQKKHEYRVISTPE